MFKRFIRMKEKGQTFVEYGVVIAVVACIAIAGLASAGNSINNKVASMSGSTTEPESTTAYWGLSTDGGLTLSTKELAASEKSKAGGTVDLTAPIFNQDTHSSTSWVSYADSIVSVNIKDSIAPRNTSSWFLGLTKLTTINNIQNLDTSKVTDMRVMFDGCASLSSLDVSHFDTSKVTDMAWMFGSCKSLTSLDVSHFDTSSVTNMGGMFEDCNSLTSLDVSHFDTSNVMNMRVMFDGCTSLSSLDVSHFDTSKVTDMGYMFDGCSKLTSLDTSHFVINEGTDTYYMYHNCHAHS